MKKYFFALSFLFCTGSYCQHHKLEYGIQSALNINTAYGSAVTKEYKSSLIGFAIGGHVQFNTSPHFGIKAQLQFDQNGWSYRSLTFMGIGITPLNKGDVLFRLNYINLPLMATYTTGKKIRFTSAAGLFTGILVSDHFITKIKEPSTSTTKSKSNSTQSINFGIAAEAGIQIPLQQKLKLDLSLHDNYGLANTSKNTASYSSDVKTNALSFLVGLTWRK